MQVEISVREEVDQSYLARIRTWAKEVLDREEISSPPPYLCLTVWKTMGKFQAFSRREREALGIVTGEEADFLATHDAWRGYPRIHVCQERLTGIPDSVIQGAIHHEIGHALHHGSPEFYTFRFSKELQQTGHSLGLDLPLLQQCVYLLSVAIKDRDVVRWLAEIGLSLSQLALIEYVISDTEEEHQAWEIVRHSPSLRKIAFAAFLKTFLPIESMIGVGIFEAEGLRERWNEAYGWLPEAEKQGLYLLARFITDLETKNFQERLEQAVFRLMAEPSL